MIRMTFVFVAAALLVAGRAPAHAEWKKYSYPADGFEVEFSGEVSVKPTPVSAETQKKVVRATAYLQDGGDFAYIVNASLHKEPVNFESGIKGSFGALKCKTAATDKPLNVSAGRARELSGDECGEDGAVRAEARYFTTGKWFYQVLFLIPRNGDLEASRRFLRSFKLTGKAS